jgi:hypothetical protein
MPINCDHAEQVIIGGVVGSTYARRGGLRLSCSARRLVLASSCCRRTRSATACSCCRPAMVRGWCVGAGRIHVPGRRRPAACMARHERAAVLAGWRLNSWRRCHCAPPRFSKATGWAGLYCSGPAASWHCSLACMHVQASAGPSGHLLSVSVSLSLSHTEKVRKSTAL